MAGASRRRTAADVPVTDVERPRRFPARLAAALALALGILAALVGSPTRPSHGIVDVASLARIVEHEEDHVTAVELAEWIRDQKPHLRVIDVRTPAEFDAYHIPSAERLSLADLSTAQLAPDEQIVLYSQGGAHAAQAWVFLRALGHQKVWFLRGGLYEWLDQVMSPTLSDSASVAERAAFQRASAVSRYYGGSPRVGGAEQAGEPGVTVPLPHTSATTRAILRVRGRGC
jgi:rhodanese-related sulfurtransferase